MTSRTASSAAFDQKVPVHDGYAEMGAVDFAAIARLLSSEARRIGLRSPSFRSPPGLLGVHRTITRKRSSTTVAVDRRRPAPAVIADMIEGVVVANGLSAADAGGVRSALWGSLPGSTAPVTDVASNVA